MEKILDLKDISSISNISQSFSHAGDDYIYSHLIFDSKSEGVVNGPGIIRFDGITIVVVKKGDFIISLTDQEYNMPERSVTILGPNDVITHSTSSGVEREIYTLFLSTDFLQGINFDFNALNPRFLIYHKPVITLSEADFDLIYEYLHLLHRCAINNSDDTHQLSLISRSIGRNIVVALMYQLALFNEQKQKSSGLNISNDDTPSYSRKINYVHEFLKLLREYYRSQRTVTFYAGKMCISPKYLSLLVKEITGQSAAAIIDRYVINEAKNMLRYSGLTIQQVAYKLNFPNQSAFGKYFKHLTGVSPTHFRAN